MIMHYKLLFSISILAISFFSVVKGQGTNQKSIHSLLASETKWRGVFTLNSGLEVPFNFLIKKNASGQNKVYFKNAEETFEAGPVKQKNDSLYVSLDQFENELVFKYENNRLTGSLRRQDYKGTPIPVVAEVNNATRFIENNIKPEGDISGTYEFSFTQPD